MISTNKTSFNYTSYVNEVSSKHSIRFDYWCSLSCFKMVWNERHFCITVNVCCVLSVACTTLSMKRFGLISSVCCRSAFVPYIKIRFKFNIGLTSFAFANIQSWMHSVDVVVVVVIVHVVHFFHFLLFVSSLVVFILRQLPFSIDWKHFVSISLFQSVSALCLCLSLSSVQSRERAKKREIKIDKSKMQMHFLRSIFRFVCFHLEMTSQTHKSWQKYFIFCADIFFCRFLLFSFVKHYRCHWMCAGSIDNLYRYQLSPSSHRRWQRCKSKRCNIVLCCRRSSFVDVRWLMFAQIGHRSEM